MGKQRPFWQLGLVKLKRGLGQLLASASLYSNSLWLEMAAFVSRVKVWLAARLPKNSTETTAMATSIGVVVAARRDGTFCHNE